MVDRAFYKYSKVCLQIFAITSMLLLISCAPQSKLAESSWSAVELAKLPTERDYPDAGAVVLLNEGKMEIFAHSELPFSVYEQHKMVRILNHRGNQYANIVIPYSSRSEVQEIEARSISPDGIITQLDKSTIYDISLYPNFIFYSDQRAKIFTMPAAETGSIIEYRFQTTIHDPTLWHAWSFQENIPTIESRFTLIKPGEWDILFRSYGPVGEPELTKAPQGFKSTHKWEMKNIPALKTEFAMPPQRELLTRIALSPIGLKSWNDVARWFNSLWSSRITSGIKIKELANKITSGITNEEEKLRLIFNWVQTNIRYIAVEIGIGGYQPHPVDDVYTNRYGDCKDMTALLCSFAHEAGIDLQQAFISTWFNGRPDTSLPSPLQFDHVIAYAPTVGIQGTWLDATDKGCPFGQLPWYDQGLPVFLVDKNGAGTVVTTPQAITDSNVIITEWDVQLDTTGTSNISGKSIFRQVIASEIRNDLIPISPDEQRTWLERYLAIQCPGSRLDTFTITGVLPIEEPLTISYRFATNSFAARNGRQIIIRPWIVESFRLSDYFRSQKRIHPVRFQFGERINVNIHITLPDNVTLLTGKKDSLVTPFGTAFWRWSIDGSKLNAIKECHFYGEEITTDNYSAFQQFLDSIRLSDMNEIILEIKHQ